MSRVLHSEIDIVRELPSVKHIKSLRTVLSTVTKTLAAYQLGHAQNWKQLHTDETSRRLISIVNVVMSIINNDNELRTICMSASETQNRPLVTITTVQWTLIPFQ